MLARRRIVFGAWAVAVIVAGALAIRLGGELQGGADVIPGSEADRVGKTIERHFGRGTLYPFVVVMRDTTRTTDSPEFIAVVDEVTRALSALPTVRSVETAWNSPRAELLGED